jgi:hypothetical protein
MYYIIYSVYNSSTVIDQSVHVYQASSPIFFLCHLFSPRAQNSDLFQYPGQSLIDEGEEGRGEGDVRIPGNYTDDNTIVYTVYAGVLHVVEEGADLLLMSDTVSKHLFAVVLFRDSYVINWFTATNLCDRSFFIDMGLLVISGWRREIFATMWFLRSFLARE